MVSKCGNISGFASVAADRKLVIVLLMQFIGSAASK
jgi:hypothetical protein